MKSSVRSFPGTMRARLVVLAMFVAIVGAALFSRAKATSRAAAPPAPSSSVDEATRIHGVSWTAPASVPVSGWVVDEDKHAVVGARVCAVSVSNQHTDEESGPYCAIVGEDGRFTIASAAAGRWDVIASANGFVPARFEPFVDLDPAIAHAPIEIVIARGGVLVEGNVDDPLGRPVGFARVEALATTESLISFPQIDVETDVLGHFALWLPEGALLLSASAVGYSSIEKQVVAPTKKAKITLGWEAVVTGRVVDQAGVGVAFARVRASGAEDHVIRSGADGAFAFTGLTGGRWSFEAIAPGLRGNSPSVLVDPGNRSDGIVLVAHPAARVEATIVSENGSPCVDGAVRIREQTGESESASTDLHGIARFDAVLPGIYEVEIDCEGKDPSGERPKLEITGADVAGLVYKVREGIAARGVVVDESGAPIANIGISASAHGKNPRWLNVSTARDGSFLLSGLSKGTWSLQFRDNRFAELEATLEVGDVDTAGLRYVLSRGLAIRGKVVDGAGAPIADVEVHIEGKSYHNAITADDGTFRVFGVAAGDHFAWVSKDSGRLESLVPIQKNEDFEGLPFTTAAAETFLELRVAAPNLVITGRVVDGSGAGVGEASVYFRRELHDEEGAGEGPDAVLTDSEGRFRLTGLAAGNYSVRARKKGIGEMAKAHVPAGGIVLLGLVAQGSVTAVLSNKFKFARVQLEDRPRGVSFTETIVAGDRVRFEDIPPGEYELSVSGEAGNGFAKITVAANDDRTVTLAIGKWASVTGTYLTDDPSHEARASLRCIDCPRSDSTSVEVVAGHFRADVLAAGTYEVEVFDLKARARGKVVALAGAVTAVTLEPVPEATSAQEDKEPMDPPTAPSEGESAPPEAD